MKQRIYSEKAPKVIGTYSQAIKSGNRVYISGQIGLDPETGELVTENVEREAQQAFSNLKNIVEVAGGQMDNIVKMTVYLMDFNDYDMVNALMQTLFEQPYPARAVVQVAGLPKGARFEVEAIMVL